MPLPVLNIYPFLKRVGAWVCPLCRQECRGQTRILWRNTDVVTGSTFNHEGLSDAPANRFVSPDIIPSWFVFWTCSTCRHWHGHFLSPFSRPEVNGEL